jgi:hypothetical protein
VSAGYSKTPLHKKLQIKPGSHVILIGAAPGWKVPELPAGVRVSAETPLAPTTEPADVIVAFSSSLEEIRRSIEALSKRIFPDGAIWSAWPRRAGGHESDITERDIRALALPLGLVDVKVAAIDDDWSGLRLVWRREHRHTQSALPQ